MIKSYQRKYLRAPYHRDILYADSTFVLRAKAINISEGGLYLEELPSFPEHDEVPIIMALPQLPDYKSFTTYQMQVYSRESIGSYVVRARVRIVRREELSQNLDNIFKARIGLEFSRIDSRDQQFVNDYVSTFSANIIFLQTLIDSFNSDQETRVRTRVLANLLGYRETEKISQLRAEVSIDYKNLQWL